MATRWYFPEAEAAAISPAIVGAWTHESVVRRRLSTTTDSDALANTAYTPDAADHLSLGSSHHRQYISDTLAAQTINGTISGFLQGFEPQPGNNLFFAAHIYIVSGDGSTVRGTLFSLDDITTGGELDGTSVASRSISATLTEVSSQAGDRLVMELGVIGDPVNSSLVQGHNATMRWGAAGNGDHTTNDSNSTTLRSWIEFTHTFTFGDAEAGQHVDVLPRRLMKAITALIGLGRLNFSGLRLRYA